jgi:hypothetical protein
VEDVSGLGSGPVVRVVQGLNALEREIRGELRRCGHVVIIIIIIIIVIIIIIIIIITIVIIIIIIIIMTAR